MVILSLVVLLLWIVRRGERLPLSSVGLRARPIGRTLVGVLAAVVAFAAALVLCLGIVLPALGTRYGAGGGPAASIAVTSLIVIRAGIAEEIFYRGYSIERLEALTKNRGLAAALPLLAFSRLHFGQGIAGVLLALFGGAASTAIYLWKRDVTILIAAHFVVDFIPNVVLPLLSRP